MAAGGVVSVSWITSAVPQLAFPFAWIPVAKLLLHCVGVCANAVAVVAFPAKFPVTSSFATSTTAAPFSETCSVPFVPNPSNDFPDAAVPSVPKLPVTLHGPAPVDTNEFAVTGPETVNALSICTFVLNSFRFALSRSSQFAPSPAFAMNPDTDFGAHQVMPILAGVPSARHYPTEGSLASFSGRY